MIQINFSRVFDDSIQLCFSISESVFSRKTKRFIDLLCKPRNKHQRKQRTEHSSSSEREQLFLAVPSGKVYHWRQAQQRFTAGHPYVKCDYVRRQ